MAQVNALAEVADSETSDKSGLKLTEIQLGLTETAEGHLAFIASASATASSGGGLIRALAAPGPAGSGAAAFFSLRFQSTPTVVAGTAR